MRTNVEFRSDKFPTYGNDEEGPNHESGVYGKRLAEYLKEKLTRKGFAVTWCDAEDWGWRIDVSHEGNYDLWIGSGHYQEYEIGFLCFIEPSKPFIRKWFKKIDVRESVKKIADALDEILNDDKDIQSIRWWDEGET
jgi:hypothetical protein